MIKVMRRWVFTRGASRASKVEGLIRQGSEFRNLGLISKWTLI
jgi:hypothetical protein